MKINYELKITNYELRITNYELRITNYELRITNYENTIIDISHLPTGMYFIQIGNYSEKFMVVR